MMKSFSESSDWYIYDNKENEENFSIGSDTDEDIRKNVQLKMIDGVTNS